MTVLVTGAAGFIGSHVAQALLRRGEPVIGVDNLNTYYEPRLKHDRLALLAAAKGFVFHQGDVSDRRFTEALGAAYPHIDRIVHLAAQAGVRASRTHPHGYVTANVQGHLCMLELARHLGGLRHMVYASSSSVYGADAEVPFAETQRAAAPMSLYAATKRADELISHSYALQYGINLTGLRFFTVYGPWGRPDMAYFLFARAIRDNQPITLFDGGRLKRDFTYIDDITAGVLAVLDRPPATAQPPVRVLNIGHHDARPVAELVFLLEAGLGRRARIVDAPRPASEVPATFADITALTALTGLVPTTNLAEGIGRFINWFRVWEPRPVTDSASI
jgi:UDP-glucuronate 4-epimerase